MSLTNSFINCECIEIYIVINEIIVLKIYKRLQIESYFLFKLKFLREYDEQLIKRFIIHCLLLILNVHDYKKELCLIFIAQLK